MPFLKKSLSVIGIILAVLIVLFIVSVIWSLYRGEDRPALVVAPNTFEIMLADSHLLYASTFSYGMCLSEVTNEDGGCHSETYLSDSGKYIATGFWEGLGDKRIEEPRVEKQLSFAVVNKIIKTIRDSGIMNKQCPDGMTVDASWDYQLQLDGQKKRFINRPVECQPTLEEIDKIIAEAANAK